MRDKLIGLINGLRVRNEVSLTDNHTKTLVDNILADGWIRPPCKVGDTVYKVDFIHNCVVVLKVEGFLCNLASWKVHCVHLIPSWVGNQKEHIYISFSSFGKTVFLTPKEADNALAERERKE